MKCPSQAGSSQAEQQLRHSSRALLSLLEERVWLTLTAWADSSSTSAAQCSREHCSQLSDHLSRQLCSSWHGKGSCSREGSPEELNTAEPVALHGTVTEQTAHSARAHFLHREIPGLKSGHLLRRLRTSLAFRGGGALISL